MEHYQKSLDLDYKNNDERKIAIVNSNIALLYLQKGAYEKAIEIYDGVAIIVIDRAVVTPGGAPAGTPRSRRRGPWSRPRSSTR